MANSGGAATSVGRSAERPESHGKRVLSSHLLQSGFRLAHILVNDKQMAFEIVTAAVSKLRVQCLREKKRSYWREKSLKRKITRLIRSQEDMLQWLIYLETTHYERQRERAGNLSTADMTIRYVKYLVQITTAMSSFYVSVGLQRLLYNYRTPEAQQTYENLTDLYPNPEAYRAVKAALMAQIKGRFGEALEICETERGERRFKSMEQQDRWLELVERCLNLFVPWSTRQACMTAGLEDMSPKGPLSGQKYRGMATDALETNWCHAFIHPPCYSELTKRALLESPWQRLALPHFYNVARREDNSDDFGADTPKLSEDELIEMMRRFNDEELERQGASPKSLRIVADGIECAKLDVAGPASSFECELAEGTKFLEVRADVNDKEILLGTHWIEYTRWNGVAPAAASLRFSPARELELRLRPIGKAGTGERRIHLCLKCGPASRANAWREFLRATTAVRPHALPKLALVSAVLLVLGWIASTVWHSQSLAQQEAVNRKLQQELISEQQTKRNLENRLQAATLAYKLTPDELRPRGTQGAQADTVHVPSQSRVVTLELPIGIAQSSSYRVLIKTFPSDEEILSEGDLAPKSRTGEVEVDVEVPSVLLQNNGEYVVDLYARGPARAWNRIHSFRFRAIKNIN